MGLSSENYSKFSAHLGIVILYGGTYPESLKRARVSQQDTKPLIYIAVDDRATGFFTDELKSFLQNAKLSALDSTGYRAYLAKCGDV